MYLGVDYYPEQWDASLMEADMDNIVELGGNIIRIAEFSWHLMEKTEGEYDFSFFDKVIETAKKKGLRVMMGTPTATIPAWLYKKHPSIASEFEGGMKRTFGGRHVYCFNSPILYEYSEKIIRALVSHYKDEKAIAAWQIDNEFGHEGSDLCYCAQCQKGFQEFLRRKFKGDIDLLNETYGTTFWSQEYNDFDEIPTPMATITTHNPALRLDFERFRSESIEKYADFQIGLIREIAPDAVIIHDFSGGCIEKHFDVSKVAKNLDVLAYNNYPVWGGMREPLKPYEIAFSIDFMRGMKQENIWITEAIMGAQGHDVTGYSPRPNQAKLWSYQAFAHGVDSMLYFRYRGATKGAEQFCYGVLDADNVKRRKYYEVQSFFKDIAQYKAAMEALTHANVAIMHDFDSLAAFRIQRQSILLDVPKEMQKFYKAFYDVNVPVDILPISADISDYQILILPELIIEKPEFSAKVKEFVRKGGIAILTFRSSVKDVNNNLVFGEKLPLGYSTFAGVTVVETESLQEGQEFPLVDMRLTGKSCDDEGCKSGDFEEKRFEGGIFRDFLEVSDAEVLYRYGDEFYTDYAAITRKKQGEGMIYYIGCGIGEDLTKCLMEEIMDAKGIRQLCTEDGVEVVWRGEGGAKVRMILNHNGYPVTFDGRELGAFEVSIEPV